MQKQINSLNYTFLTAFLVVGIVALSAIASNYSGNVRLKFGTDGVQLELNGRRDASDG